jgi:hypothetical protein
MSTGNCSRCSSRLRTGACGSTAPRAANSARRFSSSAGTAASYRARDSSYGWPVSKTSGVLAYVVRGRFEHARAPQTRRAR